MFPLSVDELIAGLGFVTVMAYGAVVIEASLAAIFLGLVAYTLLIYVLVIRPY